MRDFSYHAVDSSALRRLYALVLIVIVVVIVISQYLETVADDSPFCPAG